MEPSLKRRRNSILPSKSLGKQKWNHCSGGTITVHVKESSVSIHSPYLPAQHVARSQFPDGRGVFRYFGFTGRHSGSNVIKWSNGKEWRLVKDTPAEVEAKVLVSLRMTPPALQIGTTKRVMEPEAEPGVVELVDSESDVPMEVANRKSEKVANSELLASEEPMEVADSKSEKVADSELYAPQVPMEVSDIESEKVGSSELRASEVPMEVAGSKSEKVADSELCASEVLMEVAGSKFEKVANSELRTREMLMDVADSKSEKVADSEPHASEVPMEVADSKSEKVANSELRTCEMLMDVAGSKSEKVADSEPRVSEVPMEVVDSKSEKVADSELCAPEVLMKVAGSKSEKVADSELPDVRQLASDQVSLNSTLSTVDLSDLVLGLVKFTDSDGSGQTHQFETKSSGSSCVKATSQPVRSKELICRLQVLVDDNRNRQLLMHNQAIAKTEVQSGFAQARLEILGRSHNEVDASAVPESSMVLERQRKAVADLHKSEK